MPKQRRKRNNPKRVLKPSDPPEEDLFAQCLELPADAREAFLDSVCQGNPELRENVLSLVDSHEAHGGFLDSLEHERESWGEESGPITGSSEASGTRSAAEATSLFRYRLRKVYRKYRPLGIAAIVLGVLVYIFASYNTGSEGDGATMGNPRTNQPIDLDISEMAILPIGNQGGHPLEAALAESLLSEVQDWLGKVETISLAPAKQVAMYSDSDQSGKTIGQELGVGSLLQGDLQILGSQARIRVQLVGVADDVALWSDSYTRTIGPGNSTLIAKEIGLEVANAIAVQIVTNPPQTPQPLSHSEEALVAYQKGMELLGRGSLTRMPEAIEYFERALERDPNFALSYVGLGNARHQEEQLTPEVIPEEDRVAAMIKAADRALALDESLPEAHVLAGLGKKLEGNRTRALGSFERALQIDPNCAVAHMEMALWEFEKRIPPWDPTYPQYMDTVIDKIQMAVDCDSNEARYLYELGDKLGNLGRVGESREFYEQSVNLNPDYVNGYVGLAGNAIYFKGRFDEALPYLRKALSLDPLNLVYYSDIAECYEAVGDPATGARWKERIVAFREDMELIYQGDIYRLRGGEDRAIEHYRSVFEGNWVHPFLESIRRRLLNYDLRDGNIEAARSRYYTVKEYMYAGLALFDENPEVRSHVEAIFAMEIAPIRSALGETEAAHQLIDGSWAFFQSIPETDFVRAFYETIMYALKGEKEKAIEVLREAVDRGYRTKLDLEDARLDSLRSEPSFEEIRKLVDADMAQQLAAIRRLEASGELAPLPEFVEQL